MINDKYNEKRFLEGFLNFLKCLLTQSLYFVQIR